MIGFSAGGHLTAMTETLFDDGDSKASDPIDRVSSRPDFAVLAYAPTEWNVKFQSDTSLAEPELSPTLLRELSPVLNVSAQTPPTFIFQTNLFPRGMQPGSTMLCLQRKFLLKCTSLLKVVTVSHWA